MRLPLLLLALLVLPVALPADGPWEVFTDEAPIQASPNIESQRLGAFAEGDARSGEIWENPDTREEWLRFAHEGATGHVSMSQMHRIHPDNRRAGNLPMGEEVVDRWWGLPLGYTPDDLADIPSELTIREDRTYQLRRDACESLVEMLRAALSDDVEIRVNSAHRSGSTQRRLYLRACERRGPGQRRSARPGHSEHQLGTTVDLADPGSRFAFKEEFDQSPQGRWLAEHAAEHGWVRSYFPHNVEETGYDSEPWHWRFMGR